MPVVIKNRKDTNMKKAFLMLMGVLFLGSVQLALADEVPGDHHDDHKVIVVKKKHHHHHKAVVVHHDDVHHDDGH